MPILTPRIELKNRMPSNVDAVAVLITKAPVAEKGEKKPSPPMALHIPDGFSATVDALITAGLVTGKAGEAVVQLAAGATPARLVLLGIGEPGKATAETFRAAGGSLARAMKKHRIQSVAAFGVTDPAALSTGFALGEYDFREFKGSVTKEVMQPGLQLSIVVDDPKAHQPAVDQAITVTEAQNYARTIGSRPGNVINPPSLAAAAQKLAKEMGLTARILDDKEMKQLGMGGILAVGSGSETTPPCMIVLEYQPVTAKAPGKKPAAAVAPLLVVGKAITFDTGGISIKGAAGMQKMVFDKCGGMAVLGLMRAIATLKPAIPVVGILASAENHISGSAYRPGDILRMYNGVTVEVTNTDAEGRLVLSDALAWGIETYKPAAVVDLATLTGGVVVALGKSMAGIMANDEPLLKELQAASEITGEKVWPLPVGDDQRDLLKSDPADICNAGPREASPLQGGAFLSYFVPEKLPWAHIDIAGVADTEKDLPYYGKGATGWGVRTLVEWVSARAAAAK